MDIRERKEEFEKGNLVEDKLMRQISTQIEAGIENKDFIYDC